VLLVAAAGSAARGRQGDDETLVHAALADAVADEDNYAHAVENAISSSAAVGKDEDGNDLTPEDIEDQLVEQLAEKRSSTRLAALQRLADKLQLQYAEDFVEARLETLQLYILNSIRKGDAPEIVLACRALSLLAVTLGPDGEALVQAATPVLHTLLINTAKSPTARAAIAEALGFVTFVCGLSDADTLLAMKQLLEALQHGHPPESVTTAVWEAWGLLASSLSTSRQGGELADQHLGALVRFLDDESIDVRTAAGENIALLISARQELEAERAELEGEDGGEEAEEEAVEEEAAPAAENAAASASASASAAAPAAGPVDDLLNAAMDAAELSPRSKKRAVKGGGAKGGKAAGAASSSSAGDGTDLPSLITKLRALSTDGNRHRARKDRSAQRKSFRDILHTVEDGSLPSETLTIGKSRHEFEGWAHVKQLAAVRDVLAKGLNVHFADNQILSEIFALVIEGADGSAADGLSAAGRKEAARAQSRAKALENFHQREKGRKKKLAAMINPHGDD
jgi:hypothetical protein